MVPSMKANLRKESHTARVTKSGPQTKIKSTNTNNTQETGSMGKWRARVNFYWHRERYILEAFSTDFQMVLVRESGPMETFIKGSSSTGFSQAREYSSAVRAAGLMKESGSKVK